MQFKLTMQDCRADCITIGESSVEATVAVPVGQARAFSGMAVFRDLSEVGAPHWNYVITATRGVPDDMEEPLFSGFPGVDGK